MTKEVFVDTYYPLAKKAGDAFGLTLKYLLKLPLRVVGALAMERA